MAQQISIIVASNDKEKLDDLLIKSLYRQQDIDYELIVVDGNKYTSASTAYNAGAEQANCEYLFCSS